MIATKQGCYWQKLLGVARQMPAFSQFPEEALR